MEINTINKFTKIGCKLTFKYIIYNKNNQLEHNNYTRFDGYGSVDEQ